MAGGRAAADAGLEPPTFLCALLRCERQAFGAERSRGPPQLRERRPRAAPLKVVT